MNKSQLIDAVAADSGLTKADSARAIESFIDTVNKTLKKGDEVAITGFGKFSVVKRAARKGVNPRTGEAVKIKASKAPKFSAGAGLKAAVSPEEIGCSAMALVSELELPAFDHTDASMRGEHFHGEMARARAGGWLARGPVRIHDARQGVGRVLPAHPLGDLPWHEDRGDLRRDRGAAVSIRCSATSCTSTAPITRACAGT